ncbi:MAG: hypothetical protein GY757_00660 [bacterium]|nr:hypothetical protein [bacterium]
MQTVEIKGKTFSKIVLGTNAIYGRSHFSSARSQEYSSRCNDDYIHKMLETCMKYGVNTVESSANERIQQIIAEFNQKHQFKMQFIGNTRIDETSKMGHNEKVKFLMENKAEICVIHSQFVSRPRKTEEIRGLERLVRRIHDAGLIAAISTHDVSTVRLCETNNYGVDVYLFPMNQTGYVYPGFKGTDSAADRIDLIQNTPKPFILMKTLGAGRISPDEGLRFALDNCKDTDIISLGLASIEEAEESLGLVQEYFQQKES